MFYGFDWVVWVQVVWLSVGGLTVGACIKYADNITKDFATSIAIILATMGSVALFAFAPSWLFGVGAGIVIAGIFLYSYAGRIVSAVKVRCQLTMSQRRVHIGFGWIRNLPRPGTVPGRVFVYKNWRLPAALQQITKLFNKSKLANCSPMSESEGRKMSPGIWDTGDAFLWECYSYSNFA